MEFALTTTESDQWSIVTVTGELDVYTAPALEESLASLIESGRTALVVDLGSVDFMDSTGLGMLITALKWVKDRDGRLGVVVSSDRVLKVFQITGLDAVLPLHATLQSAVSAPV